MKYNSSIYVCGGVLFLFCLINTVLKMEARALYMLCKHSTTEPCPRHTVDLVRSEKGLRSFGAGVTIVSCHVGTENRAWVLRKSSVCS